MSDQLRLQIDDEEGLRQTWEMVLQGAEQRLGRTAVESWLRDIAPIAVEGDALILGAANPMALEWVQKKYAGILSELFEPVAGRRLAVQVTLRKVAPAEAEARPSGGAARTTTTSRTTTRPAGPPAMFAPIPLNDRWTFDNYIVGQCNRFAHAVAEAVGSEPARQFNPLFVYGGVGLGKTHLLHAIGHRAVQQDPRCRVCYVSGETFTSHFVSALRERREDDFKRWYRSVDLWLVDDVQFIADKTSTKEEFFHTFNELYLTNRQIVLASDRPPKELKLLEDRLRTRMESGMMAELLPPDLETRMAILQKHAALHGAEISPDVVLYVAQLIESNIRVLEAALLRLLVLASLNRSEITADLASKALQAYVAEGRASEVSVQLINKAVAERFGVSEEDLLGTKRDKKTSLARQIAMYLIRDLTKNSLQQVGDIYGGKTHSTVCYALSALEKQMKQDAELGQAVAQLAARLKGN